MLYLKQKQNKNQNQTRASQEVSWERKASPVYLMLKKLEEGCISHKEALKILWDLGFFLSVFHKGNIVIASTVCK